MTWLARLRELFPGPAVEEIVLAGAQGGPLFVEERNFGSDALIAEGDRPGGIEGAALGAGFAAGN